MTPNRLITLAIHTYEKALPIKNMLEREGVAVELNNVNLACPEVAAGVRIRIKEADLPLALRIVENFEIFNIPADEALPDGGKILVPTDFSDLSMMAARLAMQIAAKQKWDVVFLFAFIPPSNRDTIQLSDAYDYELADIETTKRMQSEAEELMKRFTGKIRDDIKAGTTAAARFSGIVSEGIPEEAILEYTRSEKPQMVVMGTRGADKKEAELIGSVTAEVLDACRVPAFTVPDNADPSLLSNLRHVAFFCNLDQEDILALDTLYRLFPDHKLEVTLIHIPPRRLRPSPPQAAQHNLLQYCNEHYTGYGFNVKSVRTHSVFDDLDAIAGTQPFDMICLPNKHKNVFARVFNPSLAHKILFRA
ncbi:MAG: universal stress protein, partial [Muribaculaceae bacterium]|nr:universal stress protein [Muribaculaceae bacterium]